MRPCPARPRCYEPALLAIRDLTEAASPWLGSKEALETFVREMCDVLVRHPWVREALEAGECPVAVGPDGHVSLSPEDGGRRRARPRIAPK